MPLPPRQRLSDAVYTVLGLNPGHLTLEGTNTYLIGTGSKRLLLDTGEGAEGYLENVKAGMKECGAESIEHILITHDHPDHVGGIADVRSLFPNAQLWKMNTSSTTKAANGAGGCCSSTDESASIGTMTEAKNEAEEEDKGYEYSPIVNGQLFHVEGATLQALETPGHTDDHICFYLQEEGAIFTGDCVLGGSSAVFVDLYVYMNTLHKLLRVIPDSGRLYPAHGPTIEDGHAAIQEYITHRNDREQQALQIIIDSQANGIDISAIVEKIYVDIAPSLIPAATGSIALHVEKLFREKRIRFKNDSDAPRYDNMIAQKYSGRNRVRQLCIAFHQVLWIFVPSLSSM